MLGSSAYKLSWARANRARIKQQRQLRALDPEKHLADVKAKMRHHYKRYGLTLEDFDRMLLAQNNACAICHSTLPGKEIKRRFAVDHDHATGRIRGLLCHGCNVLLGHLEKEKDIVLNAVAYLSGERIV